MEQGQIHITRVSAGEIEQLQQISRATFSETFASSNTAENMAKYLEENLSLEQLGSELANEEAEFYFARNSGNIVGYLKLNFGSAQTEIKQDNALEIERIYVLQSFQGKRIGQLLFDKALDVAKQRQADYVWLGVWEENHNAINFYTRNGFVVFDRHVFKLGEDEQTDLMMRLDLHKI